MLVMRNAGRCRDLSDGFDKVEGKIESEKITTMSKWSGRLQASGQQFLSLHLSATFLLFLLRSSVPSVTMIPYDVNILD